MNQNTMTFPFDEVAKLPPLKGDIEKKPKRYVSEPDLSVFTPEQKMGADEFTRFVEEPGGGMFVIEGYAGTGKTFFISRMVEQMLYKRPRNIAITAPTNKAVRVLRELCEYKHNLLTFKTIHSLLGLKEQIDAYGRQKFVQEYGKSSSIETQDILIVDEVSMLDDYLFGLIEPYTLGNLKIIFVGDPAQIPPINKNDCIPLDYSKAAEYRIERVRFENIIRQGLDNPIIAMTLQVRQRMGEHKVILDRTSKYKEDYSGVYYLEGERDEQLLDDLLRRFFTSENFKEDSNFAKVIAWRNVAVDWMNGLIREMIYGKDAQKIEVGEKLIADKPIIDDEDIIFTTNDELEVLEAIRERKKIKGVEMQYYMTRVRDTNTGKENWINILAAESEQEFNNMMESYKKTAMGARKGSFEAQTAWKNFYTFQKTFAQVKYNYAITAHKSQGSTYDNTIVIEADLDFNKKITERNRIKYTAFSRPRYKLFIVS